MEAERQARVEELLIKRREQEARIEQQRHEKERAREDAARERARSASCTAKHTRILTQLNTRTERTGGDLGFEKRPDLADVLCNP